MKILIEDWHGTLSGYTNHRCRCIECRAARTAYAVEWRAANRDKLAARQTAYRHANRDKVLAWQANDRASGRFRDRKYNLAPGQFDAMLAAQGNSCAICGEGFSDRPPHVDHDHACCPRGGSCGKCVRGLLCGPCNHALGSFRDDPNRMRRAIAYLAAKAVR
jgi:hypothetical protein